jgi:serralysin
MFPNPCQCEVCLGRLDGGIIRNQHRFQPNDAISTTASNPHSSGLNLGSRDRIQALQSGNQWFDRTISYSFYNTSVFQGQYYGTETGIGEVSEAVKANVHDILTWLETIIDVDFVELDEGTGTYGQIRYLQSDGPDYAYTYYPGTASDLYGDVHINPNYDRQGDTNGFGNGPGEYGYEVLIHETLHALGLKHSFEGDAVLPPAADNSSNTVMTYTFKGDAATTPMPADIEALQSIYGARSYCLGNTTYQFQRIDLYHIDGGEPLDTSTYRKQTLWDSGGIDTLDCSQLAFESEGYDFDLRGGGWLTTREANFGDWMQYGTAIAYGATLENWVTSTSDDTVVANTAANTFSGYGAGLTTGNDILRHTNLKDTLDLSSYGTAQVGQTRLGDDLRLDLNGNGRVTVQDYFDGHSLTLKFADTKILEPSFSQAMGETGRIDALTHQKQTIVLDRHYENPVVFVQPLSHNGMEPAAVRISHVKGDRFTAYIQEPTHLDGKHVAERVSYLVLEAGQWQLPNGATLAVGTTDTAATTTSRNWMRVQFGQDFPDDPAILSQVQTNRDGSFVRTRQRWGTPKGVQLALEEEEALRGSGHGSERVGWLALSSGSGDWNGHTYQAGTSAVRVTHEWQSLPFVASFRQSPQVLASIASFRGNNPAGLRYRQLGTNQVDLAIEEDKSLDAEVAHRAESVDFLAIEGDGVLTATPFAETPAAAMAPADDLTGRESEESLAGRWSDDEFIGWEHARGAAQSQLVRSSCNPSGKTSSLLGAETPTDLEPVGMPSGLEKDFNLALADRNTDLVALFRPDSLLTSQA